jgi:Domain of unknown function (DUF4412)
MKILPRLFCFATLALTPALFAADAFVGKISFPMTPAKGKPMAYQQSMKGTAMRTEFEGAPGAMIMDFAKMEMIMLMTNERMYMVMPLKPSDVPQTHHEAKPVADPDVEVTGKTENILGYTCHQILVKDGKNITEVWAAEGLGAFAGLGQQGGGMGGMFGKKNANAESAAKWERALKGRGGYPLRVITRDAAGKTTFKLEATKVEKGGVTDADFKPPAGFEKFSMPDMGGMNPFK